MLQIPILVSVVMLFPNLVHFPKIGDNDVTAGGQILEMSWTDPIFEFYIQKLVGIQNVDDLTQVDHQKSNISLHSPFISENMART